MPVIYDNSNLAAVVELRLEHEIDAREMLARDPRRYRRSPQGPLAETRDPPANQPVIPRDFVQGVPSRPVVKTGVEGHVYDLKDPAGAKLLTMDTALIDALIATHGDRFSRSNSTGRLVIYDLEHSDGHGASALQMWSADAWHAHRSNPARWVWELPRGVYPHSDRFGPNRIKLA